MHIKFSAAADKVVHQGMLYICFSVGIGGSVLLMLTEFLSNRLLHVMVVNWLTLCQESHTAMFYDRYC